MKTIYRFNSFETNSSSTHSLILCSLEDYEKLKKGELLIDENDDLVDASEVEPEREKKILNRFKDSLEWYVEKVADNKELFSEFLENFNFDSFKEFNESIMDSYNYNEYQTLDEWCDSDYLDIEEYKDEKLGVVAIAKYGWDG